MDKQFFGGENWPQLELNSHKRRARQELDQVQTRITYGQQTDPEFDDLFQRANELEQVIESIEQCYSNVWAIIEVYLYNSPYRLIY